LGEVSLQRRPEEKAGGSSETCYRDAFSLIEGLIRNWCLLFGVQGSVGKSIFVNLLLNGGEIETALIQVYGHTSNEGKISNWQLHLN